MVRDDEVWQGMVRDGGGGAGCVRGWGEGCVRVVEGCQWGV